MSFLSAPTITEVERKQSQCAIQSLELLKSNVRVQFLQYSEQLWQVASTTTGGTSRSYQQGYTEKETLNRTNTAYTRKCAVLKTNFMTQRYYGETRN